MNQNYFVFLLTSVLHECYFWLRRKKLKRFWTEQNHWRIQGGGMRAPSVYFLPFSCSFRQKDCQIIGWLTPSEKS